MKCNRSVCISGAGFHKKIKAIEIDRWQFLKKKKKKIITELSSVL